MSNMRKDKTVTVRMESELVAKLSERAEKEDRTLSNVIRGIIKKTINK